MPMKVLTKSRFLDGVVCSCGQVRDELYILACEYCADATCNECMTDCMACGKIVCHHCSGKNHKELCMWCEYDLDIKMKQAKNKKMKDIVYIVVGGMEYKVSNANGNAGLLIDATDAVAGKLKRMDVRGLGLLQYKYRNIVKRKPIMRNGQKIYPKGLAYFIHFEQVIEV